MDRFKQLLKSLLGKTKTSNVHGIQMAVFNVSHNLDFKTPPTAESLVNHCQDNMDSLTSNHVSISQTPAMATGTSKMKKAAGPPMCDEEQSTPALSGLHAAGYTEDMFSDLALKTPIWALNKSNYMICLMLNTPMVAVETHLTPDYRGLAELLGFCDIEIQNLYERNPTEDLFCQWARNQEKEPFLWNLICHLKTLGRGDVLEDCCGLISEDVAVYNAKQNILTKHTVEMPKEFDCFINIADEDLMTIGHELIDMLEGVYKLRLCFTLRNRSLGEYEFEWMAKTLKTRCHGKVVIVLSSPYYYSGACRFLTQFAVTLDPGAEKGNLIPIMMDEKVEIPHVLQGRAMLNYKRDKERDLWQSLYRAITGHVG